MTLTDFVEYCVAIANEQSAVERHSYVLKEFPERNPKDRERSQRWHDEAVARRNRACEMLRSEMRTDALSYIHKFMADWVDGASDARTAERIRQHLMTGLPWHPLSDMEE